MKISFCNRCGKELNDHQKHFGDHCFHLLFESGLSNKLSYSKKVQLAQSEDTHPLVLQLLKKNTTSNIQNALKQNPLLYPNGEINPNHKFNSLEILYEISPERIQEMIDFGDKFILRSLATNRQLSPEQISSIIIIDPTLFTSYAILFQENFNIDHAQVLASKLSTQDLKTINSKMLEVKDDTWISNAQLILSISPDPEILDFTDNINIYKHKLRTSINLTEIAHILATTNKDLYSSIMNNDNFDDKILRDTYTKNGKISNESYTRLERYMNQSLFQNLASNQNITPEIFQKLKTLSEDPRYGHVKDDLCQNQHADSNYINEQINSKMNYYLLEKNPALNKHQIKRMIKNGKMTKTLIEHKNTDTNDLYSAVFNDDLSDTAISQLYLRNIKEHKNINDHKFIAEKLSVDTIKKAINESKDYEEVESLYNLLKYRNDNKPSIQDRGLMLQLKSKINHKFKTDNIFHQDNHSQSKEMIIDLEDRLKKVLTTP